MEASRRRPGGWRLSEAPQNQARRDTRGFSRMTLSSHRLKASTSFFICQGWPMPVLVSKGVRRHPNKTARGAPYEGHPPCTRLGVAMTTPWGWLDAGSGEELIGGLKAHGEPGAPVLRRRCSHQEELRQKRRVWNPSIDLCNDVQCGSVLSVEGVRR